MMKRLVYLVEVEKHSFVDIEEHCLMNRPWQTPTPHAPPEILAAASEAGILIPPMPSKNTLKKKRKEFIFNKVSLHQRYLDHKALLAENSNRLNRELLDRAVRRSVELYGENWKKVAEYADLLLDQWTQTEAARATIEHLDQSESTQVGNEIKGREPLSSSKVAMIYRKMERKGIAWGLQDDVVMSRKILGLSRVQPDIVDILDRPWQDLSSDLNLEQQRQQDQQLKYWQEISMALGSHSPMQCKRRWDGLRDLADVNKSAQSKSWHKFERFQYWMMWRYYYEQSQQSTHSSSFEESSDSGSQSNGHELNTVDKLQNVCNQLSLAKDVSKWLRHRTQEQCEKFFRSVVNDALDLGIGAQQVSELLQEKKDKEKKNPKIRQDRLPAKMALVPKTTFDSRASLLKAIASRVAEPEFLKLITTATTSTASTPVAAETTDPVGSEAVPLQNDERSKLRDSDPLVRPDWSENRIRALSEIVVQAKQGVEHADFELDWNQIAEQLKRKLNTGLDMLSLSSGVIADKNAAGTAVLSVRDQILLHQHHSFITPSQCQRCWEYITSSAAASFASGLSLVPGSVSFISHQRNDHHAYDVGDQLGDWSDHELLLLQQGVRKFGTQWTDVQAQLLPKRSVSDLQRAWLLIQTSAKGDQARDQGGDPSGTPATPQEGQPDVRDG
ncbi:hypothetical protein BGX34_011419 [Mortierella sp. NVP85]|nr:hypothetical protein BGX34_011419 [Mortierella sp. NVP85]